METVLYTYHYILTMRFKIILEEAEEGGYVTYVPSLPGCVSQGETREEAVENIKEAIEVYLDIGEAQIEAETQKKS
jgi:predicted RNase H-like HicB family nuclease